ncbi:MAG: cell division protein FtsZ [Thermoplasmata archaeon]
MGWDLLFNEAMEFDSKSVDSRVSILAVGVGGAGCNTINTLSMIGLSDVRLISINTDKLSLDSSNASIKFLLGKKITNGQSTSGNLELGQRVAELSANELKEKIMGNDIVFIIAGLGGGTGGGAGPVIAQIAKSTGALVISIVSLPFTAEGKKKSEVAKLSLEKFFKNSNTVIVLENDTLLKIAPKLPLQKAFRVMDYLVSDIIRNISETINKPSMIHIDFADLMKIMKNGGSSTIMYGEGELNNIQGLVEDTLKNKFYNVDHTTANGALINIVSGPDMSLSMMNSIVEKITDGMDNNADIKVGTRIDEDMTNKMKITAIFTNVKYNGSIRKVSLVKEEAFSDVDSMFP